MDKLKELIETEIKSIEENGIEVSKIETLSELVDIHKDLAEEEYWNAKKEDMKMRYYEGYGEGSYGRRSRDSRGRYTEGGYSRGMYGERGTTDGRDRSRGSYGHYMPYEPMYMDRMMDGMEGYMEGREQYSRGNYGGKDQSIESLEKMLDGTLAFVEDILQNPEQNEEHKIVRHYIGKFQELL